MEPMRAKKHEIQGGFPLDWSAQTGLSGRAGKPEDPASHASLLVSLQSKMEQSQYLLSCSPGERQGKGAEGAEKSRLNPPEIRDGLWLWIKDQGLCEIDAAGPQRIHGEVL